MAKVKKAQSGVSATPSLRRGQLKRLGRIEARNPDRADRVADRMIERDTRLQRGKSFIANKVAGASQKVAGVAQKVADAASKVAVPTKKTGGKVSKKKK